MPQSAESSTGEDLPLAISPSNEQLENINSYLNLILAALVSLANLDSESITQAAQELALDSGYKRSPSCPLLATPVKPLPSGHPFSSSPPLSSSPKKARVNPSRRNSLGTSGNSRTRTSQNHAFGQLYR